MLNGGRFSKFFLVALSLTLTLGLVGLSLSGAEEVNYLEKAKDHFQAVVDQDGSLAVSVEGVIPDYYSADGAYLKWVGGPLEGMYFDHEIGETWSSFFKANDPTGYEIKSSVVQDNIVSANVVFTVKQGGDETKKIPVSYTLVYDDDYKIMGETWKIDPGILEE